MSRFPLGDLAASPARYPGENTAASTMPAHDLKSCCLGRQQIGRQSDAGAVTGLLIQPCASRMLTIRSRILHRSKRRLISPPMDRLRDLVEQLDRLHANAWLDVRRRELFKNHALHVWPRLSPAIQQLMRRVSNE